MSRLTTLKQLAAIGKIEQTIEWVDDFLQSGNKLVLACWHRQVLDTLYKHYSKIAVRIDGSTKNKDEVAQQFQTQDKYKLAIVNMKAGGVGLDLFAAAQEYTQGSLRHNQTNFHYPPPFAAKTPARRFF